MRFVRAIVTSSLLALVLVIGGCASGSPEATWDAFVAAVDEGRAEDALSHLDLVRMTERMLEQDEEMAAAAESFGGVEGIADMLEAQLLAAFESGEFGLSTDDAPILEASVTDVVTEGDTARLSIDADGEVGTVHMERIDGTWKIVLFE